MRKALEAIDSLEKRIETLLDRYRLLEQEQEVLRLENSEMKQKLTSLEGNLEELLEENRNIKIARTITGEPAAIDTTRAKINELVREIDKCIALLNE